MKIAIIGFGEAGHMFGQQLAPHYDVHAYDVIQDASMQLKATSADVTFHSDMVGAVRDAKYVFSLVTGDQAMVVARAASKHLGAEQYFLEMNSVSGETKKANALICPNLVDVAIMSPVYPKQLDVPLLVSHPDGASLAIQLKELGLNVAFIGPEIGQAAAIKMCRSLMIKGMEALTLECFQTARNFGIEAHVKASLHESFPDMGWNEGRVDYWFERVATHGLRRATEMQEVAQTVKGAQLQAHMANSIVETLREFTKAHDAGEPIKKNV